GFVRAVAPPQARREMLEGVHSASLSKSERADRQRHLEPIEEDVKDAETSRQRGEHDGEGRARAKRKQETGDEGQHGQPEAQRLWQWGCGSERNEPAADLPGRLPTRQNAPAATVTAARGL